jgi:hypothetical protein
MQKCPELKKKLLLVTLFWGNRGRMIVGFTTTCVISAYHH